MTFQRQREPVYLLILVIGLVSVAIIVILVAGRAAGPPVPPTVIPTPSPTPRPKLERRNPEPVYERTLDALEYNDVSALYNEISPDLAATFDFDGFEAGIEQSQRQLGRILEVRPISPLVIKTEAPWNGEWADAEVEILRERGTARYLVRFHRKGNEWWLFGTLELQ